MKNKTVYTCTQTGLIYFFKLFLVSCKFTVNGKYFDGNGSSKYVHILVFLANLKLTLPGIYNIFASGKNNSIPLFYECFT